MYTEWPTELSPYATRILIFFPLSIMCTDLNKLFGMLLLKEVCKKKLHNISPKHLSLCVYFTACNADVITYTNKRYRFELRQTRH